MKNPYLKQLNIFFENLLYFRHICGRINKVFEKEINDYKRKEAVIHFASALIISDWTSPNDNGWEINFHTGIMKETVKENYELEIKKNFSQQLCLLYSQSFESFERYLKDSLFEKSQRDPVLQAYIVSFFPKTQEKLLSRENFPGGKKLFKILKKAGGKSFINFSTKNNKNIRFDDLFEILSETRHSITHQGSIIENKKIYKTKYQNAIFNYLFKYQTISNEKTLIELDYKKFELLIKRFSEFSFQVFKILSIEDGFDWNTKTREIS